MKETIELGYPNGRMVLVIDQFFPCLIRQIKTIFPLINQYADEADKAAVRAYLYRYIATAQAELKRMEEERKNQYGRASGNYTHTKMMLKRAQKNLANLEE